MIPSISTPHFDVNLPSGKKCRLRAFTMKEAKILMIAGESKEQISVAVSQIIENCIVNGPKLEDMSIVDIETLFCALYTTSNAKTKHIKQYRCKNKVDGKDCNHVNNVFIDLAKAAPQGNAGPQLIDINDEYSIVIEQPTYSVFSSFSIEDEDEEDLTSVIEMMTKCITKIINKKDGSILKLNEDYTSEELYTFIDELSFDKLTEISSSISKISRLQLAANFKCEKCGFETNIILKGLYDFFG